MSRLYEAIKPVWVMENVDIANTANADTSRVALGKYRKCMFYVALEASANNAFVEGEDITITLREADAVTGGTTAILTADIDMVGAVNATEALIDVSNAADGDITINGTVFEFGSYDATLRPLEWATATELETAINGQSLGLTVVRAVNVLTLTVTEPGSQTITIVENVTHADTYASTLKANAIVEVSAEQVSNAMEYVYLNIDNAATNNADVSVVAILGSPYHQPVSQAVAVQE